MHYFDLFPYLTMRNVASISITRPAAIIIHWNVWCISQSCVTSCNSGAHLLWWRSCPAPDRCSCWSWCRWWWCWTNSWWSQIPWQHTRMIQWCWRDCPERHTLIHHDISLIHWCYQSPGHGSVEHNAEDDDGVDDEPGRAGDVPQPLIMSVVSEEYLLTFSANLGEKECDDNQHLGRGIIVELLLLLIIIELLSVTSSLSLNNPWIEMRPL